MNSTETLRAGYGKPASAEELKEAEAWRDKETKDEAKLNEDAIRRAAKLSGGDDLTEAQVQELAGKLGTGAAGAEARAALGLKSAAAMRLRGPAGTEQSRAGDERIAGSLANIGDTTSGGLGRDRRTTHAMIDKTLEKAREDAKEKQTTKIEVMFKEGTSVRIDGNRLVFDGVQAMGSTPSLA